MMKKINNKKDYLDKFKNTGKYNKNVEALKCALDIRRFEIEMYWKRTTYFWTLNAATFAGYFAIKSSSATIDGFIIPLITCIGLVISFGWYIANRGSKYWQENWEHHVDILEDKVMGPLYKTTPFTKSCMAFSPISAFPFSVSKVNQILSLFITAIWAGLVVLNISCVNNFLDKCKYSHWILTIVTMVTILALFFARTNREKNINIKMFTREINK